ncbi:hypothetical protein ACMFMG_006673 [Clarireedia jacksonii]
MEKTYRNAVTLLESRNTGAKSTRRSRASQLFRKSTCVTSDGEESGAEATTSDWSTSEADALRPSSKAMAEWLEALGYTSNAFDIIHVGGTKGKASTCHLVKSFISTYASRTGISKKVGLYTNPYSSNLREPIKIHSKPVSEEKFTRYFFEVWEKLSTKFAEDMMPDYMQLRLLVAIYTFSAEDVDIAVMETHCGGESDATNFIKPVAVGICQINRALAEPSGPSLEDITWHTGGMMKTDSPVFSIPQDLAVQKVLEARANEKAVALNFIREDSRLPITAHALKKDVMRFQCSLALALVDTYLTSLCNEKYPPLSLEDISSGLDRFFWPGRFQKLELGQNTWFLDGANNHVTVPKAAEWFAMSVSEEATMTPFAYMFRKLKQKFLNKELPMNPKVLIFSHRSRQDGGRVVESLANALEKNRVKVKHVIFTTDWDDTSKITDADISSMRDYAQRWQRISPNSSILLEPNNGAAIDLATKIGYQNHAMECLVTGSLFLVGSALRHLDPTGEKM